jgi:cytoskeletal protein CcmA (bactofilin family)
MQPHGQFGASIFIKGELSAQEDVTIGGRLEGSINVKGHRVTVSAGAEVVADIEAAEIIVAGQMLGTARAGRRIELTATADVEGELHAPAVSVADGAVFQGRLETQPARGKNLQLAS